MPRFVVLKHTMPADSDRSDHFDMMFECDGVLLTWEILEPVSDNYDGVCTRLFDHRIDYLEYEGEVSNRRGEVIRVHSGAYASEGPVASTGNEFQFELSSEHLNTTLTLRKVGEDRWQINCRPLQKL